MGEVKFKGESVALCGELPALGEKIKAFRLVRRDLSEASLDDYHGKIKVLNVAPSFETAVCAASAKSFEESIARFDGVVLLDISMDLPFAQERFCQKEGIDKSVFLSAFRSTFPQESGLRIEEGPFKGLLARTVFIIDRDDKIVYLQLVPEISQEPDYSDVEKELQKLL